MAIRPRSDASADDTRTVARTSRTQPLGAVVRVLDAKASPPRFRLPAHKCVLGAGSGADVVIQDATVSRAHLELELVPEGVIATDLGSRNGSFYLGQRFEKMTLALGSRVRLGTVEVAIELDEAQLSAPSGAPANNRYGKLLGDAPAMRRLFATLTRLEGSLISVLIEGESGCGKELIASAIHEASAVASGPFVIVNCGAIAPALVLSELFGHRRGSFTGAVADRVGAFEAADGGTLFLDEIGELPLDAQPTLLRALEAGEVRPVGETAARHVRVRIVAATNRDLTEEVKAGRFREDLYYRLGVVKLTAVPLRERAEDIPLLANHFAAAQGLAALPPEVLSELAAYRWPGNVRELRNAVQAYLAVGTMPSSRSRDDHELEAAIRKLVDPRQPYSDLKEEFVGRFTKVYLELLMKETGGNQSEAARIAGLDRSYLGKMLGRLGVK